MDNNHKFTNLDLKAKTKTEPWYVLELQIASFRYQNNPSDVWIVDLEISLQRPSPLTIAHLHTAWLLRNYDNSITRWKENEKFTGWEKLTWR